jgi:hypothetical protein
VINLTILYAVTAFLSIPESRLLFGASVVRQLWYNSGVMNSFERFMGRKMDVSKLYRSS